MNSIKYFEVVFLQEGDAHIAICRDLGIVDQGKTQESAFINLKKTTQIYLQEANLNITANLLGTEGLTFTPLSLPQVSPCKIITVLERLEFRRSSHCVVLKKQSQGGEVICTVPLRYPLASATIWNLLYFAGISCQEFFDTL